MVPQPSFRIAAMRQAGIHNPYHFRIVTAAPFSGSAEIMDSELRAVLGPGMTQSVT